MCVRLHFQGKLYTFVFNRVSIYMYIYSVFYGLFNSIIIILLYFSSGNFLKLEVYHEEIKMIKKIEKPAYLVRDKFHMHLNPSMKGVTILRYCTL